MIEIEIAEVRRLGGLPAGVKDEQLEPHIASAVQKVSAYLRGVLPTNAADIGRVRLAAASFAIAYALLRSEERRVGKECRSRWSPYH